MGRWTGQLSLRKVMCSYGVSLWCVPVAFWQAEGAVTGQGWPAGASLPPAGLRHKGEDRVGWQASGGVENEQSIHAGMDFGSMRVDSWGKASHHGGGPCLG